MTNTSKRRSAPTGTTRTQPAAAEPAGEPAAVEPAIEPGVIERAAIEPAAIEPAGTALSKTAPAGKGPASGWTLRWAIRVLRIEAVAIALLTVVLIWAAVAAANVNTETALATLAFAAICTAILAGLAAALGRGKALARAPSIVIEMLLLPMGYSMIAAGSIWLGVPTMIFGLAGSALLLAPSTRTTLGLN